MNACRLKQLGGNLYMYIHYLKMLHFTTHVLYDLAKVSSEKKLLLYQGKTIFFKPKETNYSFDLNLQLLVAILKGLTLTP